MPNLPQPHTPRKPKVWRRDPVKDRERGTSHERGYDANWQRARAAFLSDNPLCMACQVNGDLVTATVVDHIQPHRGDRDLFWDQGNWQPLCKPCHDGKTRRGE